MSNKNNKTKKINFAPLEQKCPGGNVKWENKKNLRFVEYLEHMDTAGSLGCSTGSYPKYDLEHLKYCCSKTASTKQEQLDYINFMLKKFMTMASPDAFARNKEAIDYILRWRNHLLNKYPLLRDLDLDNFDNFDNLDNASMEDEDKWTWGQQGINHWYSIMQTKSRGLNESREMPIEELVRMSNYKNSKNVEELSTNVDAALKQRNFSRTKRNITSKEKKLESVAQEKEQWNQNKELLNDAWRLYNHKPDLNVDSLDVDLDVDPDFIKIVPGEKSGGKKKKKIKQENTKKKKDEKVKPQKNEIILY